MFCALPGPQTPLCREMELNLQHTHAKFGITPNEYAILVAQLESADLHSVDWCAGTCLHGRVKPWRHETLFASASNSNSHKDAS